MSPGGAEARRISLALNLGFRPIAPELGAVSILGLELLEAVWGFWVLASHQGSWVHPGRKSTSFVDSDSGLSFNLGLGIKDTFLSWAKEVRFCFMRWISSIDFWGVLENTAGRVGGEPDP